jgi:preprotein translocase subunit SecF
MLVQILFLIIGIAVGAAIGYFAFKKPIDNSAQLVSDEKIRAAEAVSEGLRRDVQSSKAETAQERSKSEELQIKLATLQNENTNVIQKTFRPNSPRSLKTWLTGYWMTKARSSQSRMRRS